MKKTTIDYITTDCPLDEFSVFNDELSGCEFIMLDPPAGKSVQGEKYIEFYVDEAALQKTVIELFYEQCK